MVSGQWAATAQSQWGDRSHRLYGRRFRTRTGQGTVHRHGQNVRDGGPFSVYVDDPFGYEVQIGGLGVTAICGATARATCGDNRQSSPSATRRPAGLKSGARILLRHRMPTPATTAEASASGYPRAITADISLLRGLSSQRSPRPFAGTRQAQDASWPGSGRDQREQY